MASQSQSQIAPSTKEAAVPIQPGPPRRQRPDYRHIHRFSLPLTVHPLPPLIPHNPLSVISVLLSYLTYLIAPPRSDDIRSAYFDSNTSSVHVTDENTIRALWEMGFFGKGSLSRSEPTWLDQEKKRRGLLKGMTSEEVTRQRRAERRELKLQRARSEKLIIEQRLQAEAAAREGHTLPDYQSALPSSAPGVANDIALTAEKFSVKRAREARFLEAQQRAHKAAQETTIQNEEHLQLSNEEALFLVYGLGALHILDHDRKTALSPSSLLTLFCHHSYSPPRQLSMDLKTDDPFLISYIVYHHFRSLGWVVRSGIKFGVDYLLYNRGPVFSHAEFAIVVIPSYNHPYWSETEDRKAESARKEAHSWWWLHCVNRVQAQVKKSLVVCYVEVPPPSSDLESASADSLDIGALLGRYRVREVLIRHDSIDIARLQRVALGLESITSQPVFTEPGPFENNLQHRRDSVPLPPTTDPSLTSASHDDPGKTLVHGAPTAGEEEHNATELLSTNRKSLERTVPPIPGPPATKMSSADALPSDTQVISQSVYDEIIRKNKESGNHGPDSNVDPTALMSLHEGDSGHIDLLDGFNGTEIVAPNTDENDDQCSSKLGESSPLTYEPNLFPESQRFVAKTPMTGTKQHRVEGVTTISPLSASGVMALSQVFKATQAPSSPLVNGLQSDIMSDRPSPNIPIQHRPLAQSLSSPFNTIAATFPRDSSEMQLNYVTMKEMTRSADHIYSEDQSDGEFDKEPSFVERMRRQRRVDQEATAHRSEPPPQRQDWADKPAMAAEEELPEPAVRSQIPNSSTEEDKENCNDPTVSFSHAASAHDRLSQALSFHGSPLDAGREHVQPLGAHPRAQSQDRGDGQAAAIGSSPVTIVRDSQWSPGPNDEQNEQEIAESPSSRSQSRRFGSQLQSKPTAGLKQKSLSPAKQIPAQSSIQGSQFHSDRIHTAPATLSRNSSGFLNAVRFSNPSREGTPDQQTGITRFSQSVALGGTQNGDKPTTFDAHGKSSSMPSRVAETPEHYRQRSSNDLPPLATIPETSPNRINNEAWMSDTNNEAADQEDDDLPPLYPGAFERANQSKTVFADSSSPIKNMLNSKILSSPSGRQRRALTEIAADVSPQVGGATFDVNINILSADDHEFRSAVAMSPIPPRKKRRGNDGRNIAASDPIIPVTPHHARHLAPLQRPEEVATTQPPQPTEPGGRLDNSFFKRLKPARKAESFWDTEDSPKFRVSSKERSKIFARSLAKESRPPQPQEPEKETPQPIAASVPQEASSTAIAEVPISEPVVEESSADTDPQLHAENAILAPNQVLAPWRGQKRAYYPATCFGKPFGTSQDQYLVKFEDSAPVEVPGGTVKRLEFRIGDAVKVDMPNVPKVTHIVKGFTDKLSTDDLSREAANGLIPVTDVYGHSTIILGPKQRKSLPSGGLAGAENVIIVPISRVYLENILWNQLKDRAFTYSSGSGVSDSRLQTPSDRHTTPASPSTRLSRSFRHSNGVFSGMVFAVSYGDKSEVKYRITKMILENDGQILEDGFNELFEVSLNAPLATPSKSQAQRSPGGNDNLRLKPGVDEVGFTCLIADKHSRRPKYMQALALNLPCLSDRWVEDCVAKGKVLDWEIYLLPAGESSYLNGATKSRILMPYLATKARLLETVAARPNLLKGQSVLLITGRNGKADEERRKAYIFLTYALGASKIERVPDIQSARTILDQSQSDEEAPSWDWIYVDDDDKVGSKAIAAGSFGAGSFMSKKRRKSKLLESVNGDDLGLDSSVQVVGNEFVCQSLILGRLVDL
ncbi:hypothetical protein BJX99DRAFT_251655 [Aspergillus californicus]